MTLVKGEFEEALRLRLKKSMGDASSELAESLRYNLLAPGTHVRPRLMLASAEMVSVPREAALSAAISLEMIHCATLLHDDLPSLSSVDHRRGQPASHKKFGEGLTILTGDALFALATEVFLDALEKVEPEHVARGFRRLAHCAGPAGIAGGLAERRELSEQSSLDDLKRVNAKRVASLISAALQIPKDFAGIEDDSSQALALDIFAQQLGLAFQTMEDFKKVGEKDISPGHILYYLPHKEAKAMTMQRLNSATLSLSSAWGPPSQGLVQIAEEISRDIQAAQEN